MKNILIFGDLHINKNELQECKLVLDEILSLCKKYQVDKVIDLGDTFDTIKPTSEELDLFANFIKELNKPIILLAANSHESTTETESIINHFGILNNMVTVVKEYIDEKHLYCGHFVLNESKLSYGAKRSKSEFSAYKYIFLGHQHHYEIIKPNVCHLGSTRYVDFAEANDKAKVVALIENYNENNETVNFMALQSIFPMKQVSIASNAENVQQTQPNTKSQAQVKAYLDKLTSNTKVKVIVSDFEAFKHYIRFENNYKSKFIKYLRENRFELIVKTEVTTKSNKNLQESLSNYLETNKIDNEIRKVILDEIK